MEATERALWPVATGQSARRRRPMPPWQQPWVSLGSSPLSRTTEQSADHDRTNKAGYRDEDHLWSGCFEGQARCLHRTWGYPRQLPERQDRDRGAGSVLPPATGGAGGDGGDRWL